MLRWGLRNDSDRDPWKRREQKSPPDLEEMLKKFIRKLGSKKPSGSGQGGGSDESVISFKWIIIGTVSALLTLWALAGIYVVSPREEAVVQRFGKYVYTVGSGPHWIMPGIENHTKVDVQSIHTLPNYRANMLTEDENIVDVTMAIQYQVVDPKAFLFNATQPVLTLEQAMASSLRQVVGQTSLDDILTIGRQTVTESVKKQLNDIIKPYHLGVYVREVTMQPAAPPEAVTEAFNDAIKAREDKQRYINKAEAYSKRVEAEAAGKISRMKNASEAYAKQIVLQAKGDTAGYLAILKPYEASPRVTSERLYLDTMSQVLASTNNVFVEGGSNKMMVLPLDKIMSKQSKGSSSSDGAATSSWLPASAMYNAQQLRKGVTG